MSNNVNTVNSNTGHSDELAHPDVNNIGMYLNTLGATYYQPRISCQQTQQQPTSTSTSQSLAAQPLTGGSPSQSLMPQSLTAQNLMPQSLMQQQMQQQHMQQIHHQAAAAAVSGGQAYWHAYTPGSLHHNAYHHNHHQAVPGSQQFLDHTEGVLSSWQPHYSHLQYQQQAYLQSQHLHSQQQAQAQQLQMMEWSNEANAGPGQVGQVTSPIGGNVNGGGSDMSHPSTPSSYNSANGVNLQSGCHSNGNNVCQHPRAGSHPVIHLPSLELNAQAAVVTSDVSASSASRGVALPQSSASPCKMEEPSTSSGITDRSRNVLQRGASLVPDDQQLSRDADHQNGARNRSPYGWMKKPSYQSQPKPGKSVSRLPSIVVLFCRARCMLLAILGLRGRAGEKRS